MRIRAVPSAPGADQARQFLTTLVIDETIAIDAGGLGLWDRQDRHAEVRDVFITHSHLDHLATLPLHIDNVHGSGETPRIWGSAATLEVIREDLFNDRLWPDLERIGKEAGRRFYDLRVIEAESPVEIGARRVTAVEVNHIVPTFGFVVEDDAGCVVFGGDSGPTERIWEVAREAGPIRAVFMEASYPDRLAGLARLAAHLTPTMFAGEVRKFAPAGAVVAMHIKPAHHEEVVAELEAAGIDELVIARGGETYEF